jgi:tetrapyrrole methylase family protein / MazG family protein
MLSPQNIPEDLSKFESLVAIIARLRASDGCPWDRKQTHASLREYLLEECYETLATLDEGNMAKLCEELGDLLLQIMLHAQIAREAGDFEIADVLTAINKKLVYRHPHVFGEIKVNSAEDVVHNWEQLKKAERPKDVSMLDSVPQQMPALAYAQEIQRRVADAGFDWKDIEGVVDKILEEVREFQQAGSSKEKSDEFGDLLFTLVNFARRQGIDAETSLREANQRFYRRFTHMEKLCRERGLNFNSLSFDDQNRLWDEAKKAV